MLPGGALCAEAPGPGEEDDMRRYQTEGSRRLHQQTVPYLLDGVGSSFHVSSYRDYPVAMTHGKGSKLYDVDGNEYIDYVLGFGPMLLGYCRRWTGRWRSSCGGGAISPPPRRT